MNAYIKTLLICLFLASFSSISLSQVKTDTLSIYFDNDQFKFEDNEIEALKSLKNKVQLKIEIQAFADSNASIEYNIVLSQKRAYYTYFKMIDLGIQSKSILKVEGKGELIQTLYTPDLQSSRKADVIYSYIEEPKTASPPISTQDQQELETEFTEAEAGDLIQINNINFQGGTHIILEQSRPELEKLVQILKNHPSLKIEIQGHICCQFDGKDGYDAISKNNQLSVNRAYAIYRHLINQGILAERLSFKGFGSSRKIYQIEMNEEQKMANRRVEIYIIEK